MSVQSRPTTKRRRKSDVKQPDTKRQKTTRDEGGPGEIRDSTDADIMREHREGIPTPFHVCRLFYTSKDTVGKDVEMTNKVRMTPDRALDMLMGAFGTSVDVDFGARDMPRTRGRLYHLMKLAKHAKGRSLTAVAFAELARTVCIQCAFRTDRASLLLALHQLVPWKEMDGITENILHLVNMAKFRHGHFGVDGSWHDGISTHENRMNLVGLAMLCEFSVRCLLIDPLELPCVYPVRLRHITEQCGIEKRRNYARNKAVCSALSILVVCCERCGNASPLYTLGSNVIWKLAKFTHAFVLESNLFA